jgi:hypothetical protein
MKTPLPPSLIPIATLRRPLLTLLLLPVIGSASAATLQLDITTIYSGPGVPAGPTPWVAVTVDDSFGDANTVRLTIDAVGLVGDEFISDIYLNFNPILDSTALSFTPIANPTIDPIVNSISTGENAFMANGNGDFDIFFDFPPPPGATASKFTSGKVVVFDLTYTSAITANSFAYQSVDGNHTNTYAEAHVLSLGDGGEYSAWIGAPVAALEIPEPSSTALLGLGGLALMLRRRR